MSVKAWFRQLETNDRTHLRENAFIMIVAVTDHLPGCGEVVSLDNRTGGYGNR